MSKVVLIVDDDRSVRDGLRRILRKQGYDVKDASDGQKALKLLDQVNPDLIVLDIQMPGMSGITFLKEISDEAGQPRYPVLVFSGRGNLELFFENLEVEGFVEKPCPSDDIVARIQLILGGADQGEAVESSDRDVNRLLLAEDDSKAMDRLGRGLEGAGFSVEKVSNGADAIEKIILARPDVVVLRRMLSGMNGDAIADVLKRMPKTEKIAVIIYDDNGEAETGKRLMSRHNNIVCYVTESHTDRVVNAAMPLLS